ncbi:co-chaperone GroES ['Camptotheca acuminata' phytoplasma]|uniref:co-chaperone GroES n=1 Tax='Camptotheca acuminata' phytoplasma TaxID=3239192 RepID=UPI00351A8CC8
MIILIKPLKDYVVLQHKKEETKSKSGIFLKLNMDHKEQNVGIVINCGPQVKDIVPNNEVIFQDHSVTKIKIDNELYLIVKSEDIIALLS